MGPQPVGQLQARAVQGVDRWQRGVLDQVIQRHIVIEKAHIIAVDLHRFFDQSIAVEITLQAAAITASYIFCGRDSITSMPRRARMSRSSAQCSLICSTRPTNFRHDLIADAQQLVLRQNVNVIVLEGRLDQNIEKGFKRHAMGDAHVLHR